MLGNGRSICVRVMVPAVAVAMSMAMVAMMSMMVSMTVMAVMGLWSMMSGRLVMVSSVTSWNNCPQFPVVHTVTIDHSRVIAFCANVLAMVGTEGSLVKKNQKGVRRAAPVRGKEQHSVRENHEFRPGRFPTQLDDPGSPPGYRFADKRRFIFLSPS